MDLIGVAFELVLLLLLLSLHLVHLGLLLACGLLRQHGTWGVQLVGLLVQLALAWGRVRDCRGLLKLLLAWLLCLVVQLLLLLLGWRK